MSRCVSETDGGWRIEGLLRVSLIEWESAVKPEPPPQGRLCAAWGHLHISSAGGFQPLLCPLVGFQPDLCVCCSPRSGPAAEHNLLKSFLNSYVESL